MPGSCSAWHVCSQLPPILACALPARNLPARRGGWQCARWEGAGGTLRGAAGRAGRGGCRGRPERPSRASPSPPLQSQHPTSARQARTNWRQPGRRQSSPRIQIPPDAALLGSSRCAGTSGVRRGRSSTCQAQLLHQLLHGGLQAAAVALGLSSQAPQALGVGGHSVTLPAARRGSLTSCLSRSACDEDTVSAFSKDLCRAEDLTAGMCSWLCRLGSSGQRRTAWRCRSRWPGRTASGPAPAAWGPGRPARAAWRHRRCLPPSGPCRARRASAPHSCRRTPTAGEPAEVGQRTPAGGPISGTEGASRPVPLAQGQVCSGASTHLLCWAALSLARSRSPWALFRPPRRLLGSCTRPRWRSASASSCAAHDVFSWTSSAQAWQPAAC